MKTSSIPVRIQEIMDHYGLSSSAFAEKLGVQRSNISHILSGRNKPSLDFIDKFMEACPDIEPMWLIAGKGSMKKESKDTFVTKKDSSVTNVPKDLSRETFVTKPISSLSSDGTNVTVKTPSLPPAISQTNPLSSSNNASRIQGNLFSEKIQSRDQVVKPNTPAPQEMNNQGIPTNESTKKTSSHSTPEKIDPFKRILPLPHDEINSNKNEKSEKIVLEKSESKSIEKIMVFYTDKTFSVYHPE